MEMPAKRRKPAKRRLLAAAAAATLLSGVATACSSSSTTAAAGSTVSNPATTSASAATSASAPASASGSGQGKTITLGILTPLTGPVSSSFGQETVQGAQARIDLANADHELPGGEQIKLVSVDEGSSPQTSLSGTQQLVQNDHVFAVLAAGAFFYGAYRWAAQQSEPVVGDGIDGPEWNSSQYQNMFAAFGSTDDSYPSYTGMSAFFKSQGGTSYCGVGYNAPSTVGNGGAMAGSMKQAGRSGALHELRHRGGQRELHVHRAGDQAGEVQRPRQPDDAGRHPQPDHGAAERERLTQGHLHPGRLRAGSARPALLAVRRPGR